MRGHPDLASCAVHCSHCGIRFLTHPRNAHRQNLRCPFGCREHHRREQANARSRKHYRTEQGWRKKKLLNGKRSAAVSNGNMPSDSVPSETVPPETRPEEENVSSREMSAAEDEAQPSPDPSGQVTPLELEESSQEDVQLTLDGFTLDEATLASSAMLPYLAMVASLIERREVRCEELLQALLRSMRQRSIGWRTGRDYVLRYLKGHPP